MVMHGQDEIERWTSTVKLACSACHEPISTYIRLSVRPSGWTRPRTTTIRLCDDCLATIANH